jgi:phenolic acid decarboxylase
MTKLLALFLSILSFQAFGKISFDGKKFLFKYEGEQHYEVHFSKSMVKWVCVKGDELGRSETDPFQFGVIAQDVYFIQWSELDGTFVALTINLKTKKIISTGVSGSYKWIRNGEIVDLNL